MSKFILNVEKSSLEVCCLTQIRDIHGYYADPVTGIKGIPILESSLAGLGAPPGKSDTK